MIESVNLDAPGVREALGRAAELRLVGLLLERPKVGRREQVLDLAAEAVDPELRTLALRLAELDEPTYVSLLGPGGPVSPREVAYRRVEDPGWILADAASFYEAFGFRPESEDPLDHVAVVTGFAAYMALKEAYALARGGSADVVTEARARFVDTHLVPLAAGLASRLDAVAAPDLLALARFLAVRIGAPSLPAADLGPALDEGELTCGPCGGVAAPPPLG